MNKKNYYAPMHTAEHILNRMMVNLFACERSVNSHIERKKSKCDYKLDEEPSSDKIQLIQKKVNEVIDMNLTVSKELVDFDKAKEAFNLLRIKKEDNPKIRIVKIGDYDACPCIGEHLNNTNEISDFRITTTSFNNGLFRIRFKITDKRIL